MLKYFEYFNLKKILSLNIFRDLLCVNILIKINFPSKYVSKSFEYSNEENIL